MIYLCRLKKQKAVLGNGEVQLEDNDLKERLMPKIIGFKVDLCKKKVKSEHWRVVIHNQNEGVMWIIVYLGIRSGPDDFIFVC